MRHVKAFAAVSLLFIGVTVWAAEEKEATITSDQLELVDHGAVTVFTGNVVLTQGAYVLKADRVTQKKESGVADAYGSIHATWMSATGEKILAVGDRARYNPKTKVTELWENAAVTRWQTDRDTAPVKVTALSFRAVEDEHVVWAKDNVHITQGSAAWTHSDEAKYDEREKAIHLWGTQKTTVHWENADGVAHFFADRAIFFLEPKRARLMDNVQGRFTPKPS